jgi:hypothetical protein
VAPRLRDVYITEFGYESDPPDRTVKWSLATQARFLTWAEYLAQRNPQVKMWAQFEIRDGAMTRYKGGLQARKGFGGLQSGLFFANGEAKPAAVSFAAGLYASRRPHGRVLLWARIRTGAVHAVLIQGRGRRGGWRSLASSGPVRSGVLQRIVLAHASVRFRMIYRDAQGRHVGVPVPAS